MHTAKVQEIIAAAMEATQAGKAYVSYEYFAKGNVFCVAIRDMDYDFAFGAHNKLNLEANNFEAHLKDDDAADQLDAILTKIKSL